MLAKNHSHTAEEVAGFELEDIQHALELGLDDFVFAYSPTAMRAVCERSPLALRLLHGHLMDRLASCKEDASAYYERRGFARLLTNQEWLKKMERIVRGVAACEVFLVDVDECGYAEARAAEDRRLEKRAADTENRCQKEQASLQVRQLAHGVRESVLITSISHLAGRHDGIREVAVEIQPPSSQVTDALPLLGDTVFLDAKFYNGQLHMSNLIIGSRLLTIGTSTRRSWTVSNPLGVSRISGVKAGTTTIEYVGEELRVQEIETWVTALRFGTRARYEGGERLPLGADVQLSEKEMLKSMKRGDSGPDYRALRKQISRLQTAKLLITTTYPRLIEAIAASMPEDKDAQAARHTNFLRIVVTLLGDSTSSAIESAPGTITITIPTRIRVLFGKGLSSWFKEEDYYSLKSPTARRLFLLYGRHVRPYPFTLEELREYLGSRMDDEPLRKAINTAHKELHARGLILEVPRYKLNQDRLGAKTYHVELVHARSAELLVP